MSSTRTQVYLTADQRQRIDAIVERDGVTLAEVIRQALDRYLDREGTDVDAALAETYGADRSLTIPSRDEWDRG